MQEPYGKGLASHPGPESCGPTRKGGVEALTGERASGELSPEITWIPVPTLLPDAIGYTGWRAIASVRRTGRGRSTLARTEAPCTGTGRALDLPTNDGGRDASARPEASIR